MTDVPLMLGGFVFGVICLVLGISLGRFLGQQQEKKRIGRLGYVVKPGPHTFSLNCPVCGYESICDTKNIRKILEDEKPCVTCSACGASLIGPYVNHTTVKAAREAYLRLVEVNRVVRAVLEEPYHPVKQEEEDQIAREKADAERTSKSAASNAMIVLATDAQVNTALQVATKVHTK